jgi:hypothetical protein
LNIKRILFFKPLKAHKGSFIYLGAYLLALTYFFSASLAQQIVGESQTVG